MDTSPLYNEEMNQDVDTYVNERLINFSSPNEYLQYDPTPNSFYPRSNWSSLNQLTRRKLGLNNSVNSRNDWFAQRIYNSLWAIQRLQVTRCMIADSERVNTINFSPNGQLICSGGYDRDILLHSWQSTNSIATAHRITTGHQMSIYYSDFSRDGQNIISGSAGGEIRLCNISNNKSTRLFKDKRPVNQFSHVDPNTIAACVSSAVHVIDLRECGVVGSFNVNQPSIIDCQDSCKTQIAARRPLALYTISVHPSDTYKIVTGGTSPHLLLFDLRKSINDGNNIETAEPLVSRQTQTGHLVTSCSFNRVGDKLLVSQGDDDLTVNRSDTLEELHRYRGHRDKNSLNNSVWFGDQHVLTGSDDGHLYGWDMASEHIVFSPEADLRGYVSALCTHPSVPILATAGLDNHVKVWEPISEVWPQTMKWIKRRICRNMMSRRRPSQIRQHLTRVCEGE